MTTITEVVLSEMFDNFMRCAKETRARIPYSHQDGFPNTVVVLNSHGQDPLVYPARWTDMRSKRLFMRAVSSLAKEIGAEAIALISDMRWTEPDRVCEVMELPPLEQVGIDEWQKLYMRRLTEKFGGDLANLPKECWGEGIICICKGPQISTVMRIERYREGPNDSIEWIRTPKEDAKGMEANFPLLPDWWV